MKSYLIVAFTLLIVAGFGFSLAETTITQETPSLSPSHDHNLIISNPEQFIADMIPHHQEAVDTSKMMVLSDRDDVRSLASRISTAQETEIARMMEWQTAWYGRAMDTRYTPMMPRLDNLEGTTRDRAFLEGMIAHHEMAIDMTLQMLSSNPNDELKSFGTSIIEAQSVEIDEMKYILKTL